MHDNTGDEAEIVPLGGRADDAVVPDMIISAELGSIPPRSGKQLMIETMLIAPNLLKLVYRLLRDRRVPIRRKVAVGAVLAYLVSPIDVIPDVIPVIGQVDDALLLAFAVHHLMVSIDRAVVMEYWDGSEDGLDLIEAVVEWGSELVPGPVRRILGRTG